MGVYSQSIAWASGLLFAASSIAGSLDLSGSVGPGIKIVSVDAVYATNNPSDACSSPYAQDAAISSNGVSFKAKLETKLAFRDPKGCPRTLQSVDISYMVLREYEGIKSVDSCGNFNFAKDISSYGVQTISLGVDEDLSALNHDGVLTECSLDESSVVENDLGSATTRLTVLGKCSSTHDLKINPDKKNIIRNFDFSRDLPKLPNTGVVKSFTFDDGGFRIDLHPNDTGEVKGLSHVTLARTYVKPYALSMEPGEYLLKDLITENEIVVSLSVMSFDLEDRKSRALVISPLAGNYVEYVRDTKEPSAKKGKYRLYQNSSSFCVQQ